MKRIQLEKLQKLTSVLVYRRNNLQPAIPDKDYGLLATTPSKISQSELYDICKEFLKSLQVTEAHAAELAKSTADQDPSPNSLWQTL